MAKHRRRHTIGMRHEFEEAAKAPAEEVPAVTPVRRHHTRRIPRLDMSFLADTIASSRWVLLAVLGVAALATGWWFFLQPTSITVCVFSDSTFRQHHSDWPMVLHARFQGADRIFAPAGVRWKVVTPDAADPTSTLGGLATRRKALPVNTDLRAEVLVIMSGVQEGTRTGATVPFSHTAVVVDFPEQSEQQNTAILAHELAHLFGAPHDPEGVSTIMQEQPRSSSFSPRTVKLIRQLRNYDFAAGFDGLEGNWEQKAIDAIAEAEAGLYPQAAANAHQIVAAALLLGGRRAAAIRNLRAAVEAAPGSIDKRLDLADALSTNSQDDAAITELRGAALMDPNSGRTRLALGRLLAKQGNREEALKEFRSAAQVEPKSAEAHYALASAELGAGDIVTAAREFQEAIALNPDLGVAHAGLANVHFLRRDYDAAWDEVKRSRMAGFEPPAEFIANLTSKKPE